MSAQGAPLYGGLTMTADGASLLDPGNMGTQTANINQNQIQEVSLLTSAYGAEYAKGPVVFQAIGKSGSSAYHGQCGIFMPRKRRVQLGRLLLYNATNIAKANDSYYYPGGDIGGPVVLPWTHFNRNHDKLFFYAAFEDMRQNPEGSLNFRFIPTQQMMQGNFSPSYLQSLGSNFLNGSFANNGVVPCQSACYDQNGNQTVTFPGGMIPLTMIDQNSLALYKTFPQPNTNPQSNPLGANYTQLFEPASRPVGNSRLRGDYNISEKTKAFFSWNRQDEADSEPEQHLVGYRQRPSLSDADAGKSGIAGLWPRPERNAYLFADVDQ